MDFDHHNSNVSEKELASPTKRFKIGHARARVSHIGTMDISMCGSEVARRLNLDCSAISRAF